MIEPFFSTCVLCTLTALVIVSTGSYQDKVATFFDRIDLIVLQGDYHAHPEQLHAHVTGHEVITPFQGDLEVREGKITHPDVTILHDSCLAEEVTFTQGEKLFSGILVIEAGKVRERQGVHIQGKSTLSHTELGRYAFGGSGNNPLGWWTKLLDAFCFLYHHLLQLLRRQGADLLRRRPLPLCLPLPFRRMRSPGGRDRSHHRMESRCALVRHDGHPQPHKPLVQAQRDKRSY